MKISAAAYARWDYNGTAANTATVRCVLNLGELILKYIHDPKINCKYYNAETYKEFVMSPNYLNFLNSMMIESAMPDNIVPKSINNQN